MNDESAVERRYQEILDRMTGLERVQRTAALWHSGWEMIALQVREEYGAGLSDRELRYRVARRMYMSDPTFLDLLQKCYEQR
jgi:hypothetical protein